MEARLRAGKSGGQTVYYIRMDGVKGGENFDDFDVIMLFHQTLVNNFLLTITCYQGKNPNYTHEKGASPTRA
jgi:hypothetical protein